ncbi:MAG: hypothetical protein V3V89_01185 [Gammaproteobacteria bacterium]
MLRTIQSTCLIVGLFSCSVVAARWGIASVFAYPAKKQLSEWQESQKLLNQNQWGDIQADLNKALVKDPANPEILRNLGLSDEGGSNYYPVGDNSAIEARQFAYQYYQDALTGRPTWPYHWADLALVKYRLGELDTEFYMAFEHAIRLGPWEPWIQHIIADIGMHNWNNFSPEVQVSVMKTIRNGLRHIDGAKTMLGLVTRYNMLEQVCDADTDDQLLQQYCIQDKNEGLNIQLDSRLGK